MGERSQPKKLEASAYLWTESAGSGSNSKNGDYFIMHPLGYFALAPNGSTDAAILKQMGQNHQTELDTQKLQMQADLSAVNRELLSIKTVWLSLYGNGSSNQVETVPGGFQ